MNDITVFKFNIWFDVDPEHKQVRFVAAKTESEAITKIIDYNDELVKNGFSSFKFTGPWVELESVIA